jgi:hypothetical protein
LATSRIPLAYVGGRVVDDAVLDPLREARLQLVHGLAHGARQPQRVRSGRLEDSHGHGVVVVQQRAQRVPARGQLDAGHVAQPYDLSVGAGLDDDVTELLRVRQPPVRVHGQGVVDAIRRGRAAHYAGGDLRVLFADGGDHVPRRQPARRHLLRVQPDAHGVVAGAEDLDLARARDARQRVLHLQHGVVAQVDHVVTVVRRHQVHDHGDVRRALHGGHALLPHLVGQARQRLADAVLHLHLRQVHVGTHPEGDGQREDAVRRGLRRHVQHVLDAVDLLLQRRGHGLGQDARVGAGIRGPHDHRRRHHLRVLADGEGEHRDAARHHDDDGEHRREGGPVDEEAREAHAWFLRSGV